MSASRRALFVVPGGGGPSVRFRILPYLSFLERDHGIRAEVVEWGPPLRRTFAALARAREADAVLLHRILPTPPEAIALRSLARDYVYDFDDAIFGCDSSRGARPSRQRRGRFRRAVGGARIVLAGNDFLAENARVWASRVEVLPTAIDPAPYDRSPPIATEPILGWIGTRANLPYLEAILPAVSRVARRVPGARLRVVSDGRIEGAGLPIETISWSEAREAEAVAGFAVGLAPLPDDPWTRGKCGAKVLQYLAASRPAVVSPVGSHAEIVSDGESGFFATNEDDWVDRVERLLRDPDLRVRFGRRGRETVEERYSVALSAPKLAGALLDW